MKKNKIALFTGVTGFAGRFLALKLLKEGYFLIFLVRGKNAKKRVQEALAFVDLQTYFKVKNRFVVWEADLSQKDLGLNEFLSLEALSLGISEIFHLAASLSFSEKEREHIFKVNLEGTENLLKFAETLNIEAFHYMSTAFVSSFFKQAAEELIDIQRVRFNNPYEESKALAEKKVLQWAENKGLKCFIYRPSIIVGDSRSGLIPNFQGFYRYMRTYYVVAKFLEKKTGKTKKIDLPINVPGCCQATINIVTIDYVVKMVWKIICAFKPGIYHLTHNNPPNYKWLLRESLKPLNIKGPSCEEKYDQRDPFLQGLSVKIANGFKDYIPYVSKNIVFDQKNLKSVTGKKWEHPKITSKLVEILLRYAIFCNFKEDPRLKVLNEMI